MIHNSGRPSPYPLRISREVREWYEKEAEKNSRSLNGEISKLLTERMNRVKGQRVSEEHK